MNSFAGGVFLATCLTHLLPHAIEESVAFDSGRFPLQYFLIMVRVVCLCAHVHPRMKLVADQK